MSDDRPNLFVERGLALHAQHPDWSPRQVVTAAIHGQDSSEFRDATARAERAAKLFAATGRLDGAAMRLLRNKPNLRGELATIDLGFVKVVRFAPSRVAPPEHVGAVVITFRGWRRLHRFDINYMRPYRIDKLAERKANSR